MVVRGEIWLAALDPVIGSEIQKTGACVVISPSEIHDYLRTVIVAPMTTGSKPAPFRITLQFAKKTGFIVLDQIRTIDKQRLIKRVGAVDDSTLTSTLD